jgi:hypothetical protein
MTEQSLNLGGGVDEMGPIDYVVIEFPGARLTGEGLPMLLDLVDRKIIRVIDLLFVQKSTDGVITVIDIADFDGDGALDLAVFQGASSGLLGTDDVNEAGAVLEEGSAAAILVYENLWAAPLAVALRKGGAQLVANGRIPVQALIGALDEAERLDRERTGSDTIGEPALADAPGAGKE